MDEGFEPLKKHEVISLGKDYRDNWDMFRFPLVFLAKEVPIQIARHLIYNWNTYRKEREKLFTEGLESEVLKFGADDWQKGKVRFRVVVEFCPDEPEEAAPETNQPEISEPESPLDDLRRELNQEN